MERTEGTIIKTEPGWPGKEELSDSSCMGFQNDSGNAENQSLMDQIDIKEEFPYSVSQIKDELVDVKDEFVMPKVFSTEDQSLSMVVDDGPDIKGITEEQRKELSQQCLDPMSNAVKQEKPYKCSICRKSLKYRSSLKRHRFMHGGNLCYQCNDCGKRFSRPYLLKQHMIRHTEVMPFICSFCSRGFMFRSSLMTHEMVHTGGQPYRCNVCMLSFTRRRRLNKHMIQHREEELHACAQYKTMPVPVLLKRVCKRVPTNDIKLVIKEKDISSYMEGNTYVCDECGSRFTRPSSFKSHKAIHSYYKK